MRARTVAIGAGLVGGLGWMAKLVIMALQGGPDPASAPESAAFVVGLVGVLIGAAAAGTHLGRGRSVARRVLSAVAGVLAVGAVISLGQLLLSALPGESWVQEEAIFGIVGLLAVVVATAAVVRGNEEGRHPRRGG